MTGSRVAKASLLMVLMMMRRLNRCEVCLSIGVIVLIIDLLVKDILIEQDDSCASRIQNILLEIARRDIEHDTSNYNFSQSGVHSLKDFVMETGGRPQRTLIVSTCRSGSTFLGDLLYYAVPSTLYTFEPLLMYKSKQGHNALDMVKRILKCNFEGLEDFLTTRLKHNPYEKQWQYCKVKRNINLCLKTEVVSWFCKLFPFQNMKVVRLRLRLIEEILDDEELNIKVVLLIRDPRGVMQSRLHVTFCKKSPDCLNPSMLCANMVSDYEAAARILQQYPDRLLVIRFEELALQTNKTLVEMLNFLKVPRMPILDKYLLTHTSEDAGGAFSTTRVSQNVPFKWKTKLDFQYVSDLQMACTEAMRLWGYKKAHNETHMKSEDFHPVADYTIS